MPRTRILAVTALSALALAPATAAAHQGNPNYRSTILSVTPKVPGVSLEVVNYDDSFELTNRSEQTIVMEGYDGEAYLRFKPDGTVEVNENSEAGYINDERDGSGAVPPNATRDAAPDWKLVDKTGRYVWHDHRIHYMGKGLPPSIKDQSKKQKVYDWEVPFRIGTQPAMVKGELTWVGKAGGGASPLAFGALGLLLLAGVGAVVVRRRRDASESPAPGSTAEAW